MTKKEFKIIHLDPLAQGVSKEEGKPLFLSKTLPDETGNYHILKNLSKIYFGKVVKFNNISPERIVAKCAHYHKCSGCHYLHTSYTKEILYKKLVLEYLFNSLYSKNIKCIESQSRFYSRNRIQLHYNRKSLGLIDSSHNIFEIPNCLIINEKVKKTVSKLYKNNYWKKLISNGPSEGHIVVSESGFTLNGRDKGMVFGQINNYINERIVSDIDSILGKYQSLKLLELFSGSGNLTKQLDSTKVSVDKYPGKGDHFIKLDLYSKLAFESLAKQLTFDPNFLLINPPRTGFKNLLEWVEKLSIKSILYLSCNPHTLKRDILPLVKMGFIIDKITLYDMFPGTYHFETLCLLSFPKK